MVHHPNYEMALPSAQSAARTISCSERQDLIIRHKSLKYNKLSPLLPIFKAISALSLRLLVAGGWFGAGVGWLGGSGSYHPVG